MIFFSFSLCLFLSVSAFASNRRCFSEHLKESLIINKERFKVYEGLTQGRSNKIFSSLIAMERLSLMPAIYFDLRARKYEKKGIDLFCKEFRSINREGLLELGEIPDYKFESFHYIEVKALLMEALRKEDINEVKRLSYQAAEALKNAPHFNCMQRHIFESTYRFMHFLDLRELQIKESELKSPRRLILQATKLQVAALDYASKIDSWSASLQAEGFPVVCSELPNLFEDLQILEIQS